MACPHLVMGDDLALLLIQPTVLLFQPGDDALYRLREILHLDVGSPAPCRHQCGLVHQVC